MRNRVNVFCLTVWAMILGMDLGRGASTFSVLIAGLVVALYGADVFTLGAMADKAMNELNEDKKEGDKQ